MFVVFGFLCFVEEGYSPEIRFQLTYLNEIICINSVLSMIFLRNLVQETVQEST